MKTLTGYVYNTYLFLKSWYDSPTRMGALFPSFARTGRIIASIIKDPANVKVVELGAGTGQVTDQIVAAGVAQENFASIEFDKKFCSELLKKHPNLQLFNIDATTMAEQLPSKFVGKTDYIISTLPLITLGQKKAKEVIEAVFKVMRPGGVYIQITFSPIKPKYMKKMGLRATKICMSWINLPPTHIWRICKRSQLQATEVPSMVPAMT